MAQTSPSFDKPQFWRQNVAFLRDAGRRIWERPGGTLAGAYVELVGDSGVMSYEELVRSGAVDPDRPDAFVGVDKDRGVIYRHRTKKVPFETSSNTLDGCLRSLLVQGRPVSVVCYDGYDRVASKAFETFAWVASGIIEAALRDRGEIAFIFNNSLRGVRLDDRDRMREHLRLISAALGRGPVPESALSTYRSGGRRVRMATVRVVVTADGILASREAERPAEPRSLSQREEADSRFQDG